MQKASFENLFLLAKILCQGQSRRIKIDVSTEAHSGTLPLICQNIGAVYAGSIYADSINKDKYANRYVFVNLSVAFDYLISSVIAN